MRIHRSKIFLRASAGRRDGFTLVELLVILAVIAVLTALQVTAMAKATGQNKRAQCASNLRQLTLAMYIFANENGDKLPDNAAANWTWDVPGNVGTFVESTGSRWSVMYCPGTAPRFTETDNFTLYNFAAPNYRVLGYATTFPNTGSVASTNWNLTLTPPLIQSGVGVFTRPLASERVLLADATISDIGQNNEAQRANYNYTYIPGGYAKAHLSPHLIGKIPVGGNVAMLDGHVEWRKFQDMHVRTTGSSLTFWW